MTNLTILGLHISYSILILSGFVAIISLIDEEVFSYMSVFFLIYLCSKLLLLNNELVSL